MNVPQVRPPSGRRRKDVAKHKVMALNALTTSSSGSAKAEQQQRKPVDEELDEIPTAEELEAQMKLFGRLHDETTLEEWLGLGQASTIAEDLAAEADETRRRELEFVQRYESLFGDARERMALLPPDVLEELIELEMQQQKELERQQEESESLVSPTAAAASGKGGKKKRKKLFVPLNYMMMRRDKNLGDGNAIETDEDDMELARNSAGELIEQEVDDDATVENCWQAELALRRALVSNGLADLGGGNDQFIYTSTDGINDASAAAVAGIVPPASSSGGGSNNDENHRNRRVPLSRQLLDIVSSSSHSPSAAGTNQEQQQRMGSKRKKRGLGAQSSLYDTETGEELFDEDEVYGKNSGEPLFIPVEPHYVGECPADSSDSCGSSSSSSNLDRGEEEDNDVREDDDTPDARSLGIMALDAADEAHDHKSRSVTSQLPAVQKLVTLQPSAFEMETKTLLGEARGLVAEMNSFIYSVEQDFWTDVQQRSLTRKLSKNKNFFDQVLSKNASREEPSSGGIVGDDDDDNFYSNLFFPGRGPEDEAMDRLRSFIERAVFHIDSTLAEPLPEKSAAEPADKLLPDEGSRAAARKKKAQRSVQGHGTKSFFLGLGGSNGADDGSSASGVQEALQNSKQQSGGSTEYFASSPSLSPQSSLSPPNSPSAVQTANAILSTDQTSTNTGAATASAALEWEDRRYAVVLNVLVTLLDQLLHKNNSIIQTTEGALERIMGRMRMLEATSLAHVLLRDEALGEVHSAVEQIQALVRAATRVAVHAQDEAVFRGVAQIFVIAARRMQDFAREVARIGEVAMLDAADLRHRLEAAKKDHESVAVALLELADAIETQPLMVPRHDQWRRRALDELFTTMSTSMSTLATLELAADERADAVVSSTHVAAHIRDLVVKQKRSFVEVALVYAEALREGQEEEGAPAAGEIKDQASVMTGVALAIAARRRLREMGRTTDRDWGFSIF